MRVDMMIQGLWDRQVKYINCIKLDDNDMGFYKYETMAALLAWW